MRTLLASALLASLVVFAGGCPLGCGAFSGGSDQVYARGGDQLILCENGGFSASVSGGAIEGFYTEQPAGGAVAYTGTNGATGADAFALSLATDGTAMIPQFGAGAWDKLALDQTALDHADTLCQNLETRAWWTSAR
jgi:hypothetical protein